MRSRKRREDEEWKREGRLGREKKKGRKMRKGEEKMRIRKREGG